ncbi:MAG: glutathione peroxidase [Paludibacteraceae bacterium]|nr:glutathione peroxidase [Paludibacteraceae bacterium]
MKKLITILSLGLLLILPACAKKNSNNNTDKIMKIYDFTVLDTKKQPVQLAQWEGKVLLVVNTATGCGFTPQYEALEKLYKKYKDQGLVILDFPCNQFGQQAPGTEEEIVSFCQLKYNVSFPQFAKIDVNGENESPLFTYLKEQAPTEEYHGLAAKGTGAMLKKISKTYEKESDIRWNFTKFLVDREGTVVGRFAPTTKPEDIESEILKVL